MNVLPGTLTFKLVGGRTCWTLPKSLQAGAVAVASSRSRPRGRQPRGPCRFRLRLGAPARRPDGRAGPGPAARAGPRAAAAASRVAAGASAAASATAFASFTPGELPPPDGGAFYTLFLRLSEGVLAPCRKRVPRKHLSCSLPAEGPASPSRPVTRFPPHTRTRPPSPSLVLRCRRSRGLWRGTRHLGVWAPRAQKPFLRLPVLPACAPQDWHVTCKYPGHLVPQSREPPRGETSPLRPALVWWAREERGAPEPCPVTSSSASLWVRSIVWTTRSCRFMKVASDHVGFFLG